jgi:regulatory protein YycI of two-component signal transduction system YycFG
LDLNTISFISTIDIGNGKDSNKNNNIIIPPVQVFPTYAIAIIVLLCLGIIIILGWLYYRKSSKLKNAKEFEENMEAVWASSDIKQDTQYSKNRGSKYNKNTSNALDSNTTDPSNNEDTETTFNETNIMNLPFFQHEVDIEDLSPLNAADQENTG